MLIQGVSYQHTKFHRKQWIKLDIMIHTYLLSLLLYECIYKIGLHYDLNRQARSNDNYE